MIYYENTKSCIVPGSPNGSRQDVKNTKKFTYRQTNIRHITDDWNLCLILHRKWAITNFKK